MRNCSKKGRFVSFVCSFVSCFSWWDGREGKGGGVVGGGPVLPLLSTACHSSFDFWTGKVILGVVDFLELKRLPRKDGVGMGFASTAAA